MEIIKEYEDFIGLGLAIAFVWFMCYKLLNTEWWE